jgi:crotonobetainyl-CoA:carnitine CoA-transferase CaiB-like acyl-CoA transferase
VRAGAGKVWLSITGYGREAPMRDWIAYGDDAGVAAGLSWLLRRAGAGNVFCADAIADPLTGLHGALLGWAAWTRGGGVLLDVSLHGVISRCIAAGQGATKTWPVHHPAFPAHPPCARPAAAPAAIPGSHTARVLSEFGIRA